MVSQERGNVPSMTNRRCATGVKAALHAGESARDRECFGLGNWVCNPSVKPVTARLFKLGAGGVRSDQHCTAQQNIPLSAAFNSPTYTVSTVGDYFVCNSVSKKRFALAEGACEEIQSPSSCLH